MSDDRSDFQRLYDAACGTSASSTAYNEFLNGRPISGDGETIFVTAQECDRWHSDAVLRNECLMMAKEQGHGMDVTTIGGFHLAHATTHVCGGCHGSGMASSFGEHEHTCRSCNGAGHVWGWL